MFLFRRHPSWFIVTSNVFLLFPILVSFYKEEWIYFIVATTICFASIGFHYGFEFYNKKSPITQSFRILDWLLAIVGTMYVFFYISESTAHIDLKILFAGLFMLTIGFFWYAFILSDYEKLHPWFHIFSPLVLGFIVLFL